MPIILIIGIFIGAMYALSLRADVDELKSIEDKESFRLSNMPDYKRRIYSYGR